MIPTLIPLDILKLDAADPLAHKRGDFVLPQNVIYMDGNSLGPLPVGVTERISDVLSQQWGQDLIHSWNAHQWIDLPTTVGEKIAPLIGAAPEQVICCDSISINLFKLVASALALNPQRKIVLSQRDNFPTDLYMAQGLAKLLGEQRCQLQQVTAGQMEASLDDSIAVLMLTQVNFRSGHLHDIKRLTKLAQQHGVLVIWDLAHSAGALEVNLDADNVDFAVGCGYKYLNGGPGAPAFVYVAKRHQADATQPLSGWMGHRAPFDFESDYQAGDGIKRYLSGTPGIISMAALDAALEVFADVDMAQLRSKSVALGELFIRLVREAPSLKPLKLISPTDPARRGSQLAFSHPQAFAISQALIEQKVIVDFRAPDIVRFGFTPLYLRFRDIWQAVQILENIVSSEVYLDAQYQQRNTVT